MFTHLILWLWLTGLVFLAAGLFAIGKEVVAASGPGKWITRWTELGPVFVAAPLATFGAEHFVNAIFMQPMVPSWLPAHLFWVYFVGCAWIAGAIGLLTPKFVRLSATLLGVMFLLLVLTMDLPFAITHPGDWLAWTMVLRQTAFAGGLWALAGSLNRPSLAGKQNAEKQNWMVLFGHLTVASAVIYFGLAQLLHPALAPGVPDTKLTPASIPLHAFWGYPVGAFLLLAGVALLINLKPRTAAASIGILMTLLSALLYLPILAVTHDPSQMTEAINFVADTLMFGGTALLVAKSLPGIRKQG
jgi:uncharacterized membrane protein